MLSSILCHKAFDELAPAVQEHLESLGSAFWSHLCDETKEPVVLGRVFANGMNYFITDARFDGRITQALVDDARPFVPANDCRDTGMFLDVSIPPAPASVFINQFKRCFIA